MSHEVPFERSDGAAIPEHCTLSSLFMLHLFNNAGRICLVRWIFATYEVACFLLYCMQTDGNAEQMLQMYHTGVRLLLNPDGRNCALSASSIKFRSVCFLVNSQVCDFACGQIHFSIKHSRRLTSEQRRNVSIIFYENIRQACIDNTHCRSWFPLSPSRQMYK